MSPRRIALLFMLMLGILAGPTACALPQPPPPPQSLLLTDQQRENVIAESPTHEGAQALLQAGYRPLYLSIFTDAKGAKSYYLMFVRCEQRNNIDCRKQVAPTLEYPYVRVPVKETPTETKVQLDNRFTLVFPANRDDNAQYCWLQKPAPLDTKTVSQFKEIGNLFKVTESWWDLNAPDGGQTNDGRIWTCSLEDRI